MCQLLEIAESTCRGRSRAEARLNEGVSQVADQALRLTFEYDAQGIRIAERDSIAKDLPESDNIDSSSTTGFFVELRAADDSLVHQRLVGAYLGSRSEVLTEGGKLELVDHEALITGAFDVLVPELAEAQDVVVLASSDRMSTQMAQTLGVVDGPAQSILRAPLREQDVGNV